MNTLEGFVGDGLLKEDSVIVIATPAHLEYLAARLQTQNFNVEELIANDRYFPLEAGKCLAEFMVDGWPNEKLFLEFIDTIIPRAKKNGRKLRAFGEMVALLWAEGKYGATVQLENIWHRLQSNRQFCLYCAYPKVGFTMNPAESMEQICKTHTMVIDGDARPSTEIYYRNS